MTPSISTAYDEGFDPADPCHVSAKIPAAALKGIEIWVAEMFADRAAIRALRMPTR
jgi:hypothetical protein